MLEIEPLDHLVLHEDKKGPRHYLAGRALEDGDELEVRGPVGWVRANYRWSGRVEFWPRVTPCAGARLTTDQIAVLRRFGPHSRCRWPEANQAEGRLQRG